MWIGRKNFFFLSPSTEIIKLSCTQMMVEREKNLLLLSPSAPIFSQQYKSCPLSFLPWNLSPSPPPPSPPPPRWMWLLRACQDFSSRGRDIYGISISREVGSLVLLLSVAGEGRRGRGRAIKQGKHLNPGEKEEDFEEPQMDEGGGGIVLDQQREGGRTDRGFLGESLLVGWGDGGRKKQPISHDRGRGGVVGWCCTNIVVRYTSPSLNKTFSPCLRGRFRPLPPFPPPRFPLEALSLSTPLLSSRGLSKLVTRFT